MEDGLLLVEDVYRLAFVVVFRGSFKHVAIEMLVLRFHMLQHNIGRAIAIGQFRVHIRRCGYVSLLRGM